MTSPTTPDLLEVLRERGVPPADLEALQDRAAALRADQQGSDEAYWKDYVVTEQARRASYPPDFDQSEELARLHDLVSDRSAEFERLFEEALAVGLSEPVVVVHSVEQVESVGVVERVEALKLATTLRSVHGKGLRTPAPEGWFSVLAIGDGASVVYARQRSPLRAARAAGPSVS